MFFFKQLKSALVKPLLKKSNIDPNDLKNYRPISNLSFLSKLIERVIAARLSSHLSSHNLMSKLQSAYRKFHSSETALLYVQNDILASLDAGHSTALLLLDLSAAFDTIDHSISTHRLQHWFGISSTALNLLSSFLSDRFQTVITPASKSNPVLLEYGVPQGSVLDPCSILYTQLHFIQLYRNILAFDAIFIQMTLKYTYRFLLNWLLLLSHLLKLVLRIFFRG